VLVVSDGRVTALPRGWCCAPYVPGLPARRYRHSVSTQRRDPRRGGAALDPLAEFGRNEPCWCGSGRKYKECHLLAHLSAPGAPVPEDTTDEVYVAPHTAVAREAWRSPDGPVPITTQVPVPQATPLSVPDLVRALATRPNQPAHSHSELGDLRYALLDTHGIQDPNKVSAGHHDTQLERLRADLAAGALDLARATLDRLLLNAKSAQAPVVLRSDAPDVVRLVGQTLLWADHYLLDDELAGLAARQDDSSDAWRSAVADLLTLRPLVEAGIVVPALSDLPLALLSDAIDRAVTTDLADAGYVAWLEQQVIVEGPTAREAAFVHLHDDYDRDGRMYLLNRVVPGSAGTSPGGQTVQFTGRMLGRYDPAHDYRPWLNTVRRQTLAGAVRGLIADVSVSQAVGAQYVTTSPFRARALARSPVLQQARWPQRDISGAVWADVPWLPDADPALLLKIAATEERVDDLRRATARALSTVRQNDLAGAAQAIAATAGDLRDAGERLTISLQRDVVLNGLAPAGLAAGSVLVAATIALPVCLGAVLAASAAAVPALRARTSARESAAYAFWLARPRPRRR
jgi:SEC-C motif